MSPVDNRLVLIGLISIMAGLLGIVLPVFTSLDGVLMYPAVVMVAAGILMLVAGKMSSTAGPQSPVSGRKDCDERD